MRHKRLYIVLFSLIVLILMAFAVGGFWLADYNHRFPASKFTQAYKDRLMRSPTVFLDRNDEQLGSIGGSRDFRIHSVSASQHDLKALSRILFAKEDRKIKSFDGISYSGIPGLIEATLEVISWKGKIRAVVQTLSGSTQGASGLLEQIAGNLYAHDDHTVWFKSGLLRRIESKLVKTINAIRLAHLYENAEQVVEDYVNLTYSAGMYHGINAFMMQRFDRDIDQILVPIDLDDVYLSDAHIDIINMLAYYAGQLTGPANYDPGMARNPIEEFRIKKRAGFKKNLVLEQMLDLGMIQQQVYLKATQRKLPFREGNIADVKYDPNIEVLRRRAIDQMGSRLSGNVHTTLIKELHDLLNYELLKHRTVLSIKATGAYLPSSAPLLTSARPDPYEIYRVKVVKRQGNRVTVDLGVRMGHREVELPGVIRAPYTRHFEPGKLITIGIDRFDSSGLPVISLIQKESLIKGAVILKSLSDGRVLAFGGGGYLNASISPGSAFKPILLDLALKYGWRLKYRLNNGCFKKYRMLTGPPYSPDNFSRCVETKEGFERYPDLKTVIKQSINKPVVYLLDHLTDPLSDNEYRDIVDRVIGPYQPDGIEEAYGVWFRNNALEFYMATDDGDNRFVGKLPVAGEKNRLLFEKVKREAYHRATEEERYLEAVQIMDQSFEDFLRWNAAVPAVRERFAGLSVALEAWEEANEQQGSAMPSKSIELNHFYYDEEGQLHYDPFSRDSITFVDWNLVSEFLESRDAGEVLLGEFRVEDYQLYASLIDTYSEWPEETFFREMMRFHPRIRGLVSIQLFKEHLADLLDTDPRDILGNYSLPLGTHRVSLVELSNLYAQILTESARDDKARNDQSLFIDPEQVGTKRSNQPVPPGDFKLNADAPLFEALQAARQEKGGTSYHLRSKAIVAGKTGTDPKYKTYVAVVMINGYPYLATAYFGVDHNKHEPLVNAWTGGWTAAVFIDRVVSVIQQEYRHLLPENVQETVAFDPLFDYDATDDRLASDEGDQVRESDAEGVTEQQPTVIWEADGSYRLEFEQKPEASTPSDLEPASSVDMEYTQEEIDQLLKAEEETLE